MDLSGQYTIPTSQKLVWEAMNDAEILKVCIPGCEELEQISDTEFTAKVSLKVGMIKAKMKGNVVLSQIDNPNGYTITGQGQGGIAGFAKGGAQVHLSQIDEGHTLLSYEAKAELGGKLAAVGSRVIGGIAKKMADDFFSKLVVQLGG
jgi:carbon monoxide dehydrogenase subunit G